MLHYHITFVFIALSIFVSIVYAGTGTGQGTTCDDVDSNGYLNYTGTGTMTIAANEDWYLSSGDDILYRDCDITTLYAPFITKIEPYTTNYLGGGLFYNNDYLESFSAPKLETIEYGNFAFSACDKLKSFDAPELTSIEKDNGDTATSTFQSCPLLETVNAPKLKKLGDNTFSHCASLKHFDGPEVTELGAFTFTLSNLEYYYGPEVTKLDGTGTFSQCNNLKTLYLPKLTSKTSTNHFSNIPKLKAIYVNNTFEADIDDDYAYEVFIYDKDNSDELCNDDCFKDSNELCMKRENDASDKSCVSVGDVSAVCDGIWNSETNRCQESVDSQDASALKSAYQLLTSCSD